MTENIKNRTDEEIEALALSYMREGIAPFKVKMLERLNPIMGQLSNLRSRFVFDIKRSPELLSVIELAAGYLKRNLEDYNSIGIESLITSEMDVIAQAIPMCELFLTSPLYETMEKTDYKFPERCLFDDLEDKGVILAQAEETDDSCPEFIFHDFDKATKVGY